MKIPNKRELQQIAFNHSLDIDFLYLYKKCFAKSYSFLVIDASDIFTCPKESCKKNVKTNHDN